MRAASWGRCIHFRTRSSNDWAPSETRLTPDSRQARALSGVTSSGFASRVTSTSLRIADCGLRIDRNRVSMASGGSSEGRSEEHTSELQSRLHLVCRLLLEKKKKRYR